MSTANVTYSSTHFDCLCFAQRFAKQRYRYFPAGLRREREYASITMIELKIYVTQAPIGLVLDPCRRA